MAAQFIPIKFADAEPVIQRYNPFQRAMELERMRNEEAYRNQELNLGIGRLMAENKRIQEQGQQKTDANFQKIMSTLQKENSAFPGGVFFPQINKKFQNTEKSLSDEYMTTGKINMANAQQTLSNLIGDVAKAKEAQTLMNNETKDIQKSWPIADNSGLSAYISKKWFGNEDGTGIKNIDDLDMYKLNNNFSTDYHLLPFINQQKVFSDVIKAMGNYTHTAETGGGNDLGSYLKKVSESSIPFSTVNANGEPVIGKVPEGSLAHQLIKDNISPKPIVNNQLYEAMMGTPAGKLANMQLDKFNSSRDAKNQIKEGTPEADYIKKRYMYQMMIGQIKSKLSTIQTSRTTKTAADLSKQSQPPESNSAYRILNDVKTGNYEDLDQIGLKTNTPNLPGYQFPGNVNLTSLFHGVSGSLFGKTPEGKDWVINAVISPRGSKKLIVHLQDPLNSKNNKTVIPDISDFNNFAITLTKHQLGQKEADLLNAQINNEIGNKNITPKKTSSPKHLSPAKKPTQAEADAFLAKFKQ